MDHLLTRHHLKWVCVAAHEKAQWILVSARIPFEDLTVRNVLGHVVWDPANLAWEGFVGPDLAGSFRAVHTDAFTAAKTAVLTVYDEQVRLVNEIMAEIHAETTC